MSASPTTGVAALRDHPHLLDGDGARTDHYQNPATAAMGSAPTRDASRSMASAAVARFDYVKSRDKVWETRRGNHCLDNCKKY